MGTATASEGKERLGIGTRIAGSPETHGTTYRVVDELISSYGSGGVNGFGRFVSPTKPIAVQIFKQTQEILFPGYFEEHGLQRIERTDIHARVERLSMTLRLVLGHCNLLGESGEASGADSAETLAGLKEATIQQFLVSLPEVRGQLLADADMLLNEDPAAKSMEEVILCYPGFLALTAYRVARLLHRAGVRLIPRAIMEHVHSVTGIDINPGAEIDFPIFIDHGTGIVIGETAVIGKRVKLYHGVTLGAFSVRKSMAIHKRHPTVHDGVTIYAGSTILGGETVIGRNAVIGANVWITQSVPEGAKVMR